MATTLPAAGPFSQGANACFLLVAMFGDVLLIRLALTLAYLFLLVGASTGYPHWTGFDPSGPVAVDNLVWAAICLLLHSFALCRLLLDERPIHFKSEDEEQLWRFFYRRAGMGRLEFKQVLKYGQWLRVPARQQILGACEGRVRLCLLVEGLASLHTCYRGWEDAGKPLFSGAIFDKALLNVFGVYVGFEKGPDKLLRAVAHTDCLLYTWTVEELNIMATQLGPAVASFWRNFALCQLGLEFDFQAHVGAEPLCATAEPERPELLTGARSRDFTDALRPYEQQRRTLRCTLGWLWRSLTPFLPAGVRHNALPVNGILARNRVVAVKTAEAWAALSREPPLAGGKRQGVCGVSELVPGVSVHGGEEAQRRLQRMQNMEDIEAADIEQLARDLAAHGRYNFIVGTAVKAGEASSDERPGAHSKTPSPHPSGAYATLAVETARGRGQQGNRKVLQVSVLK